MKMFVLMATKLHEQHKVCLSKLVLCSLYELLATSSRNIIERSYLNSLQIGGPIWLLQLWLNATFVPTLHSDIPSSIIVGAKGSRLALITPGDGETLLQQTFEKYTFMFYKSKTFVSIIVVQNGSANLSPILLLKGKKKSMEYLWSIFCLLLNGRSSPLVKEV